MPKVMTKEAFLKKAILTHEYKYDYSKVEIKSSKKNVTIICKIHGKFSQRIDRHLKGCGCKKCATDRSRRCNNFIEESKKLFGDKYDYSFVKNVKSNKIKVKLVCNDCGSKLKISYHNHINHKMGCWDCSYVTRALKKTKNSEWFIEGSKVVHNKKYDYSKTVYVGSKKPVIIICKKHGNFSQIPNSHLMGRGCPKCRHFSSGEIKITNFLISNKIKYKFQHKYKDLRGKNKRYLKFDFYLPKYNLLIEFDGQQHHDKNNRWYTNALVKNDRKKNRYAKKNNINFLRIKYTKIKQIDKILKNYLKLI